MPIDFSRRLLDLWGGTLEQICPGATEEPEETESVAPNALHADESTAVTADDVVLNTVPLSGGAVSSTEKEYTFTETSSLVKARVMLGKKACENDVILLAATM
jgi:hypothetical protein